MFSATIAMRDREVASHLAHTQEIAGSSPAPATKRCLKITGDVLRASGTNAVKLPIKDGTIRMPKVMMYLWVKLFIKHMFGWQKSILTGLEI